MDVNTPMANIETGTYEAEFCSAITWDDKKPGNICQLCTSSSQFRSRSSSKLCLIFVRRNSGKQTWPQTSRRPYHIFSPFEHLRLKRQGGARAGQIPSLSRSSTVVLSVFEHMRRLTSKFDLWIMNLPYCTMHFRLPQAKPTQRAANPTSTVPLAMLVVGRPWGKPQRNV